MDIYRRARFPSVSRRGSARGSAALAGLAGVLVFLVVAMVYLAGQNSMTLGDIPSLLTTIPLWFYIAIGVVAAAFAGVALREPKPSAEGDVESAPSSRPRVEPRVEVFEPQFGLGVPTAVAGREVVVSNPIPPKPVILARPAVAPAMKTTFASKKTAPPKPSVPPMAIRPAIPTESKSLVKTESLVESSSVVNPESPPFSAPEPEPAPEPAPARVPDPAPAIEPRPAEVRSRTPEPDVLADEPAASEPMPEPEVALEDLESWLEETSPEALAARKKRLVRHRAEPRA